MVLDWFCFSNIVDLSFHYSGSIELNVCEKGITKTQLDLTETNIENCLTGNISYPYDIKISLHRGCLCFLFFV